MLWYFALLLLSGLIGGFLAGLTGVGGGVIYISVLPFILRKLGVPESEIVPYTIANSISATFLGALSANISFIRRKQFFFREILVMSAASMASSAFVTKKIVTQPWYSEKIFNSVVIALLLVMFTATLLRVNRKRSEEDEHPEPRIQPWKLLFSGVMAGVVASVSGLGGGVIVIPILHVLLGMHIKKAAVVSLGVITINSLFITILNFFEKPTNPYDGFSLGYVIFPVSIMLGIGVVLASPKGVKTATRLSAKHVTYIFVAMLLIVMIKKVFSFFL